MDSLLEPEQSLSQHQVLDAPWGEIGRSVTLGIVAGISKLVLGVLNRLEVDGADTFLQHVLDRKPGQGLITVSNHTSTVDDPVVLSALTPLSFFFTEHQHHGARWSLCAAELCYRNAMLGKFFQSGKTLPIARGSGLNQPALRGAAAAVGRGDWLHIFPEGRVVYTGTLGELRWGVGKVICDAMREGDGRQPVVLPLYHSGMAEVMPYRARLPRTGQSVHVMVGQPVPLDDISCNCNREGIDQRQVWQDLTSRISQALLELEAKCPPNSAQPEGVEKFGGKHPKRTPQPA